MKTRYAKARGYVAAACATLFLGIAGAVSLQDRQTTSADETQTGIVISMVVPESPADQALAEANLGGTSPFPDLASSIASTPTNVPEAPTATVAPRAVASASVQAAAAPAHAATVAIPTASANLATTSLPATPSKAPPTPQALAPATPTLLPTVRSLPTATSQRLPIVAIQPHTRSRAS